MLSYLLAGVQGFLGGMALGPGSAPQRGLGDTVFAAAREEAVYRAGPALVAAAAGKALPVGLGAAVFAADHVMHETHSFSTGARRFADVFLGGLLYESAYKQHGFAGAVCCHVVHNLAAQFGAHTRARQARSTGLGDHRRRTRVRRARR